MALPLTISALIAAAAAAAVALPFLRRPRTTGQPPPWAQQQPPLDLLELRDRALAALSELEFDHRTGKIGDADYLRLLGPLRLEAAEALRLVEGAHPDADPPQQTAKRRRRGALQTTGKAR